MTLRFALPIAIALGLGGCTIPVMPAQQARTTPYTDIHYNEHPDYRRWMEQIGERYAMDTRDPDPSRLPKDIDLCYWVAKGAVDPEQNIPTCLILDYTGYHDNQVAARRTGRPGNPYFSMDTAGARWARYAPMAGITDPDAMFKIMRDGYRFVKPDADNMYRPPTLRYDFRPLAHING